MKYMVVLVPASIISIFMTSVIYIEPFRDYLEENHHQLLASIRQYVTIEDAPHLEEMKRIKHINNEADKGIKHAYMVYCIVYNIYRI